MLFSFSSFYIVTAVAVAVIPTYWSNLKKKRKYFFLPSNPHTRESPNAQNILFLFLFCTDSTSSFIDSTPLLALVHSIFWGSFGYSTIANCKLK
jgi:hypothetical protein